MSDPREDGHLEWRRLDDEWYRAKERWRDGTTERFRRDHWEPLEADTKSYLRSLEQLLDILRAAQQEADRY